MEKNWFKSMTFYGCACLFIGGGLEALGVTGALDILGKLAAILGLPLTGLGIRRALD